MRKILPTYRLRSFADEAEYEAYVAKINEQNEAKKKAAKKISKIKVLFFRFRGKNALW